MRSLMLGLWMMAATLLVAQPRSRNGRWHSGRNVEEMKTELSLNDEQYASIKAINEEYVSRYLVLRRDSTMDRSKKIAEVITLKEEREKEIEAVFTPDQKTKWMALKESRAKKMKQRLNERENKHARRMKEALSLTDEQQAGMKVAAEAFREKSRAVRDSENLSAEEKTAEIRKLKTGHEEAVKSILTEEQFKRWEEFKGKHRFKNKRRRYHQK